MIYGANGEIFKNWDDAKSKVESVMPLRERRGLIRSTRTSKMKTETASR